jgi:hypothetical protein
VDSTFPPEQSVQPVPPSSYRDRRGGLLACGIILILCGGLAALGIPLVLLGALLSRKATGSAMPVGTYFTSVMTYSFLAGLLVTLGIGSIQVRRWARALVMILSSVWLTVGILVTVLITAVLPASFMAGFRQGASMNPNAPAPSPALIAVILTIFIVLFSVFLVVLPLGLLLFYRTNNVAETFQHRDPQPRWTDRCPMPVLTISLLFACAAPYYLFMSFTTPLIPFFGRYLTGIPGGLGCALLAGLDAYLALSFFRLKLVGWWVAVGYLTLRTVSAAITFRRGDLLRAYSSLGWKEPQLQAMASNPIFRSGVVLWWSLAFTLLFLGYVVWLKRYFRSPTDHVEAITSSASL